MNVSKKSLPKLQGKAPPQQTPAWQVAGVCLVLAAMTWAVFGQTLRHGFVDYDDSDYVYDNPVVARGLTRQGMAWAFTGAHAGNWHPVTWLSHMLDCQFYGLNPGRHHLTSVLLHTASVMALFLVLRQMTGAFWRSAFVAAVFAIHPLRAESVAWVAERKDVLSGLFFMLTIWAYVRYADHLKLQIANCKFYYMLAALFFALGLMSKPMLVTLPVVLLLLDYWPLQRKESKRWLVMEKLPLLALSAAVCVVTLLAQHQAIGSLSLPERLGNAAASCMVYLGQMVYPAGLAAVYPYPRHGLPGWEVALAGTLLAGLSVAAWAGRQRRPWVLMGWLWYLVMLLPVVGVVQAGVQAHADRFTYLPQIGIYVAVTWLAAQWGAWRQIGRVALGGLMAAALAGLMLGAVKQTAYWKNSQTLWTHALACTTDNDFADYGLANALIQMGREDEAMAYYRDALQINPANAQAHNNLGNALAQKGKLDEAITHFQQALQTKPDFAEAQNNLGRTFLQNGSVSQAITHFQLALQLDPANPSIQNNLAWLLATCPDASRRNGGQAVQIAQQANALTDGKNPIILHTLAAALAESGQFEQARRAVQAAIALAQAEGRQDWAGQFNNELKLYEAGRPFHLP